MGVAAAENHITGIVFICLVKVIELINNKLPQKFSPALFVPLLSGLKHILRCQHR